MATAHSVLVMTLVTRDSAGRPPTYDMKGLHYAINP